MLAKILSDVLQVDSVRPSDRFFELGGHSLLAITAVGRIHQESQIQISLRDFLSSATFLDLHTQLQNSLAPCSDRHQMVDHSASHRHQRVDGNDTHPHQTVDTNLCPLSPSQARLYFLDRMGEQGGYIVPALADVQGFADLDRFRFALNQIAQRHEILRSRFLDQQGEIFQCVEAEFSVPIEVREFTNRDEAKNWIDQRIRQPFDLERGPLWNVSIAKYAADRFWLLINMHHIVTDGWSMQPMIGELQHFYRLNKDTATFDLPVLPMQYADFARQAAITRPSENEIAYWKEQLTDFRPSDLITDFPPPSPFDYGGHSIQRRLDSSLGKLISDGCREIGVSPSSIWLAALAILLRKQRHGDDLIFGVPVAGRDQPDIQALIGFFVNTLAIRLRCDSQTAKQTSAASWVRNVADVLSGALEYQSTPIEEVMEIVRPERRLDRSPLFQVLFNYAAELPEQIELGDLVLKPVVPESHFAKFELTFSANQFKDCDEFLLVIEYATKLYRQSSIERMMDQWIELVVQIANEPKRPIAQLALDRSVVSPTRNSDQRVAAEPNFRFAESFDQIVSDPAIADQIAICCESETLTYRELEFQSDQLIQRIAEQSSVLLSPAKQIETYLQLVGAMRTEKTIVLDEYLLQHDWPGEIAIIMPTSGSTGQAKSIAVRRSSLDHHNVSFIQQLNIIRNDRVAQFSTVSFDLFLEETLPTLRAGASLYVVPEDCRLDLLRFSEWVAEHKITILDLPTAVFHALVELNQATRLSDSVRHLVVGGEKLSASAAAKFAHQNPQITLWNSYGPTEATIICTLHQYDPDIDRQDVPLGDSFADTELTVVDPGRMPVPIGVVGELVIGGPGVAAGYVQNGRITADEGFFMDAISQEIRFATGDKVYRDSDGHLRYLGRWDQQVKV